jgi:alpha-L-fucosidase 2
MLDGLVEHNLLPNMLTTHPPLQLDGNFGITAGICEMLLQSHAGEIRCLPGIHASVWPEGSFRGLRARGGFEVGARWRPGSVTVELSAKRAGFVIVKGPLPLASLTELESGTALLASATERGGVRFETRAGGHYRLQFG